MSTEVSFVGYIPISEQCSTRARSPSPNLRLTCVRHALSVRPRIELELRRTSTGRLSGRQGTAANREAVENHAERDVGKGRKSGTERFTIASVRSTLDRLLSFLTSQWDISLASLLFRASLERFADMSRTILNISSEHVEVMVLGFLDNVGAVFPFAYGAMGKGQEARGYRKGTG